MGQRFHVLAYSVPQTGWIHSPNEQDLVQSKQIIFDTFFFTCLLSNGKWIQVLFSCLILTWYYRCVDHVSKGIWLNNPQWRLQQRFSMKAHCESKRLCHRSNKIFQWPCKSQTNSFCRVLKRNSLIFVPVPVPGMRPAQAFITRAPLLSPVLRELQGTATEMVTPQQV